MALKRQILDLMEYQWFWLAAKNMYGLTNHCHLVRFPNPLASGSDIQIHVSWGTRLLSPNQATILQVQAVKIRVFTSTLMFLRAPVPTWKWNVESILEGKIFFASKKCEETFKITMETNHVGGNAIIGSSVFLCHIWKDEHIALKRTLLL